jgi:hypothetical protein
VDLRRPHHREIWLRGERTDDHRPDGNDRAFILYLIACLDFHSPAHVESEILELRPSRSHPDRGIATVRSETVNERGEIVRVLIAKLVVPRRTS